MPPLYSRVSERHTNVLLICRYCNTLSQKSKPCLASGRNLFAREPMEPSAGRRSGPLHMAGSPVSAAADTSVSAWTGSGPERGTHDPLLPPQGRTAPAHRIGDQRQRRLLLPGRGGDAAVRAGDPGIASPGLPISLPPPGQALRHWKKSWSASAQVSQANWALPWPRASPPSFPAGTASRTRRSAICWVLPARSSAISQGASWGSAPP